MSDRSFGRNPAPAWMRPITERLSPTIRNLVIVEAVLFGLYIMAAPLRVPMTAHLALGPLVAAGRILAARQRAVRSPRSVGVRLRPYWPVVRGRDHRAHPGPAAISCSSSLALGCPPTSPWRCSGHGPAMARHLRGLRRLRAGPLRGAGRAIRPEPRCACSAVSCFRRAS